MEQTTTKLSLRSRITSSSNSFQPRTDSSIRTVWTGLSRSPKRTFSSRSPASKAIAPPAPPRVNEGRISTG